MNADRILVRLPNWTGDMVMATPALRALRSGFPSAQITAHVRESLVPLLEGSPHCDEILPLRSWKRGALATWREGRALAERNFDLGICFPDSWSSAGLMRAAGIPVVVGYRRAFREVLLQRAVAPLAEWGAKREVARERYLLHLVEQLGCESRGVELELAFSEEDERRARDVVGEACGGAYAVVAPGAGNGTAKRWGVASFARVAEGLAERGLRSIVIGAPGEIELGRGVVEEAVCDVLDVSGRLPLGTVKALLAGAELLISNDAGARHIAVAFGTPAVVVFGPTSVTKTDCNLGRVAAVAAEVSCRPCRLRECPIDHRCMTRIPASEVLDRAGELVAASSTAAKARRAD